MARDTATVEVTKEEIPPAVAEARGRELRWKDEEDGS